METIQLQSVGKAELESIIMRCMVTALRNHQPPQEKPQYDGLTPHEAKDFLTANGYPIGSVQTLYGLVHKRQIPFAKRGKRLIFSRKDLKKWLTENSVPTDKERFEDIERIIK